MIIISGITSSLGICLSLFLAEKGIKVLGFARNIDSVKTLLSHPLIQLKSADINDEATMHSICLNADVIVHLAALSSPWGKYTDFYKVNVEGTKSMINAAKEAKVNRFIHISTPSIYFDYQDRFNISETDLLPKTYVNSYAKTKKLAEEVVDLAFSEGLPTITLRPRAIFGPFDKTLFPRVLKACREKGVPSFGKNSPIIDITYVDNVVHAIWLAINAPSTCLGQKYNITNDEPAPLTRILDHLFTELSLPLKIRSVPYPLGFAAAIFSEMKAFFVNKEPALTRYGVGVLTYSQTLCIKKAKDELNYQPIISLNEGIKRYANWLQAQ